MADKLGSWIKANVATLITLLSMIFFAGAGFQRLNDHERRLELYEKDHETLIRLDTNVGMLLRHFGIPPASSKE